PNSDLFSIAVGDFNDDRRPDVVAGGLTSDNVSVLLGEGDGSLTPLPQGVAVGPRPRGGFAADFNGDGRLDLATVAQDTGEVSVLLGLGDGTFRPETRVAPGTKAFDVEGLAGGDINGDGLIDLVTSNGDILLNTGGGKFVV